MSQVPALQPHRREPSETAQNRRPRRAGGTIGENSWRDRHFRQSVAGHFENAELADRTESVLDRTYDSVRVMSLPSKYSPVSTTCSSALGPPGCRPSSRARRSRSVHSPLGREQQLRRRLADLTDAAGSGLHLERKTVWIESRTMSDGRSWAMASRTRSRRFRPVSTKRLPDLQTLTTRLDLMLGFLTRAVQDGPMSRATFAAACSSNGICRCPVRRQEARATRHDATAKHAIELPMPVEIRSAAEIWTSA